MDSLNGKILQEFLPRIATSCDGVPDFIDCPSLNPPEKKVDPFSIANLTENIPNKIAIMKSLVNIILSYLFMKIAYLLLIFSLLSLFKTHSIQVLQVSLTFFNCCNQCCV